jgi:hypothetical protein
VVIHKADATAGMLKLAVLVVLANLVRSEEQCPQPSEGTSVETAECRSQLRIFNKADAMVRILYVEADGRENHVYDLVRQ